jgi:hypothetical protein
MSSLAHRYTDTPAGDIVLVLTSREAIALDAIVSEGAEGLLTDKAAAAAYTGTRAEIYAGKRAVEIVRIAAGAARQLLPVKRRREIGA